MSHVSKKLPAYALAGLTIATPPTVHTSGNHDRRTPEVILPSHADAQNDEPARMLVPELRGGRAQASTSSTIVTGVLIAQGADGQPIWLRIKGPPEPVITVYLAEPPADTERT